MIGSAIPARNGVAAVLEIGQTAIQLPEPAGIDSMPSGSSRSERPIPPAVPEGFYVAQTYRRIAPTNPGPGNIAWVEVFGQLGNRYVRNDESTFLMIREPLVDQFKAVWSAKDFVVLEELPSGTSTDREYSRSFLLQTLPERGKPAVIAATLTFLRINRRLVVINAYARRDEFAWTRSITHEFAAAAFAANGVTAPASSPENKAAFPRGGGGGGRGLVQLLVLLLRPIWELAKKGFRRFAQWLEGPSAWIRSGASRVKARILRVFEYKVNRDK